jgi:16S rRNA (guanine527-N7)-methyltransferase
VDSAHISRLLEPFLAGPLSAAQLQSISTYIDILLRWNARINLTAVRDVENIVTRHFGESLFAARTLFPEPTSSDVHLVDLGSGAGFPGLPIKIWAPEISVTLIEANHKKATFLREVIRALTLPSAEAFAGRAEDFPPSTADVVTLRAVERFDAALPIAARLAKPSGRLALLIGEAQLSSARQILPSRSWTSTPIPQSEKRVLAISEPEQ